MNQNVFIELINPFKDKVFRLAKRLLTSTEEAEDATQEVIVKLWNKKENLDSYNSIEANHIRLTTSLPHLLKQTKSHLKLTALAITVDKDVERTHIKLHSFLPHPLVKPQRLLHIATLHHIPIQHGVVNANARLPVDQSLHRLKR